MNSKNIVTGDMIEPINAGLEQLVRLQTREHIHRASQLFDCPLPLIPVMFDLRGRAAGMYRVFNGERMIRYNPYLFAKYYDDNVATTVPHEVAHYVVDMLYGANNVKPHGLEWQRVMRSFGTEPKATANYDLAGIPVRRQKRHAYQCACTLHHISTARHNRILSGKTRYYCRKCNSALISANSNQ